MFCPFLGDVCRSEECMLFVVDSGDCALTSIAKRLIIASEDIRGILKELKFKDY